MYHYHKCNGCDKRKRCYRPHVKCQTYYYFVCDTNDCASIAMRDWPIKSQRKDHVRVIR